MRTRSWQPVVAALLLALLTVLATLQYRWLGEVSDAERERLRAGLRARAAEFTTEFNRDVTRTFVAFQIDPRVFESDPPRTIADAAARAARESVSGASVKAVLVAESDTPDRVSRFNPDTGTLEPSAWPPELAHLAERMTAHPVVGVPGLPLPPGVAGESIDADAPALIVPMVLPQPIEDVRPGQVIITSATVPVRWRAIVVWLDADALRERLLEPLVARHFEEGAASEFDLTIAPRAGGATLYRTGAADVAPASADLSADFFALKLDEMRWTRPIDEKPSGAGSDRTLTDRFAIAIVRRGVPGEAGDAPRTLVPGAAWQLRVQAKEGSLDALVARSRLRNMSVSLGVLALLGASVGLLLIVSAREQRLARQQIEFVASVSHELRTPLAVIRSAGENLADGVVGGDQVAAYGALIRSEGRRLSDMVDRVMDFAGIGSGAVVRSPRTIDVKDAIAAVVDSLGPDARDRGVTFKVRSAADLPAVSADADALRAAFQNGVGNAVKYSAAGGLVEVDVAAAGATVRIVISDRGIGIDEDEIGRVFEPFFRGRRAVASEVRGSGVGLGIVDKVVRAHGGDVRIANREGGGTVLTIELPAATGGTEAV